ncbi:MAG: hypothetical protein HZA53_18435, partial [Planctomycetes bacterium]|nr:hypothetical protein [Planctomycetota bacterium]
VDATRAAELTRGSTLPPRAQVFTLDAPLTLPNEEGWWTLRAELLRTTTGEVLGHRDLAHVHTPAPAFERWSVLFALALTLALLVLGRPGTRGDALLMLAIVGATGSAALSLEA